jgi:hypothetical protein
VNAPKTIYLTPKDIADTLRLIAAEADGKIILAHVMTLRHMADLVEQSAKVPA